MSPALIVQLVMQLVPLLLKLYQDLKDGHYDGDGGAEKFIAHSKDLVQKVEEAHKKLA